MINGDVGEPMLPVTGVVGNGGRCSLTRSGWRE